MLKARVWKILSNNTHRVTWLFEFCPFINNKNSRVNYLAVMTGATTWIAPFTSAQTLTFGLWMTLTLSWYAGVSGQYWLVLASMFLINHWSPQRLGFICMTVMPQCICEGQARAQRHILKSRILIWQQNITTTDKYQQIWCILFFQSFPQWFSSLDFAVFLVHSASLNLLKWAQHFFFVLFCRCRCSAFTLLLFFLTSLQVICRVACVGVCVCV